MQLIAITPQADDDAPAWQQEEPASQVTRATREMYEHVGYVPPWGGYLVVEDSRGIGTCAFKAPPADGRVEIAYFTFPGWENRGVATRMAAALIRIAREAVPGLTITAQTLPQENSSTTVLKKNGFRLLRELRHPEDGRIWEWQLDDS